ncbi:MAG: hypothetical protein CMJ57_02830 [Planctomycetaceae bacterium]|nr:hypothetical protein [Planctomycetaceae bacterium]
MIARIFNQSGSTINNKIDIITLAPFQGIHPSTTAKRVSTSQTLQQVDRTITSDIVIGKITNTINQVGAC